ncbi:MAG: hypothetical protein ACTSYG_01465 [Candidatus Heimdallarchaeota archaeon]
MRLKNTILILSLMLIFSPILAVVGTTPVNEPVVVAPQDFDSDFLVPEGATLYYDILQATFPDIPDVTLPDFAGNSLYVKVNYVETDHDFGGGVIGTVVWYTMGLIFEQDETFTIGEGVDAINVVIPKGAATPGPMIKSIPHFNDSHYGPAIFFVNDDWADHAVKLDYLNFTIDVNDATTFKASYSDAYGEAEVQYRKSDGIAEYILLDNLTFLEVPNLSFELSLNHVENRPLALNVGDDISFSLDTFNVDITANGDFSSMIDTANITDTLNTYESHEGVVFSKFVVTGIYGDFVLCDSYFYNFETEQLEKTPDGVVFNTFAAAIKTSGDPFSYKYYEDGGVGDPDWEFVESFGPWVTPDWDIYKGIMILANTAFGTYFDEIMSAIEIPADEVTINTMTSSTELVNKRSFYYFKIAATADVEINTTSSSPDLFSINAVYDEEAHLTFDFQGYLAYHESGAGAVIRLQADLTADHVNGTGHDMGDFSVSIDFKLRNHDYNPPDIIRGGFIPGFTWLIAIPTLLGLAALGLISRRK